MNEGKDRTMALIVLGTVVIIGEIALVILDAYGAGSGAGYATLGTAVGTGIGALAMYVKQAP